MAVTCATSGTVGSSAASARWCGGCVPSRSSDPRSASGIEEASDRSRRRQGAAPEALPHPPRTLRDGKPSTLVVARHARVVVSDQMERYLLRLEGNHSTLTPLVGVP